tara:strand:- start:5229 stop:6752 length:1524 start_codon:yes stop_codon:yes gene_type:complete
MASKIRIKRSTGTVAPGSLLFGELGITQDGSGNQGNKGDRLFAGDNAGNVQVVGGRYFMDMLDHVHGTTTADSAIITDSNSKISVLNVDNLTFDGNTVSSTNAGGDIIFDPNGSGEVNVIDDTFLSFGTDKDAKIKYDEASTDQLQASGADWLFAQTTESTTKNTGAVIVDGGVGIEKNLNVGGAAQITGLSTFTGIGTFVSDLYVGGDLHVADDINIDEFTGRNLLVTGIATFQGHTYVSGDLLVDNIGISSNVISTKSGGGNQLYIDPYPDGLSNEGTVIIKGDLQVDGTTTTVNSTSVTANEAIFKLGDTISKRSVMATVGSGTSVITLDSIVGINTGDTLAAAGLPGAGTTTVHSYNTGAKQVRIDGVTTAGIATETQVTVTHGYDTNTDRGIAYNYNTGSGGVDGNKTGFFGYEDSSSKWTYVPDATITNSVVTGTKGYLDIKGIYYQSGDFASSGVVYFDANGLQTSTVAPASGINTSYHVLTTTEAGVPTWTDTLDGGFF